MVFIWLSVAVGVTLLAAMIVAVTQEMKEEFEEDVGFSDHARAEGEAERAAFAHPRKHSWQTAM